MELERKRNKIVQLNLNQITAPSKDLSKSVPFYQKLGLKLIVNSLPRYARFVCPDGNSTFSLLQTDSPPNEHGIVMYFECENLDVFVKTLKSKGIKFTEEPTDQVWLWREARLEDPDGNKLVLYSAGENRLNPPWKVD